MSVLQVPISEPQPVKEDESRTQGPKNDLDAILSHFIQASYSKSSPGPTLAPAVTLFGSLRDHRLKVQVPFAVSFSTEESQVIAEASEIDEFGFGETCSEALADLQRAITELYFSLSQDKDRLGPDLIRVWAILQQKVTIVQRHEGQGI